MFVVGQPAFSSACVWQSPPQQTVFASRQLVPQSTGLPQDFRFVTVPQRPAQVALGPDFTIGWDSNAADFAMTLGEFYCKGLTAPVMVEIKRDEVVFARVYDIRGRSISSLLAIPAP